MINFSNEEIKSKSAEWSLNEDVKLLNKLKHLDELLSSKTKEILENVNQTDNKVSNETILVKNLINDFYLVGHKQFTENRVEEEDESKMYDEKRIKSPDHDESFGQSVDQDTLIHNQMKSALENSLKFVRTKLKDLNQDKSLQSTDRSQQSTGLDENERLEKLIRMSKYHQKKLPPIVNSDEFMNEVFNLVKESSSKAKNVNSNVSESKGETSSISDLENISINEKILEINEHNFIDNLSTTTPQSSTSYDGVNEISRKDVSHANSSLVNQRASSPKLDASQTYKQDEIETTDSHSLRRELDAIFGKVESNAKNDAKNRLFDEDDSDDELFQPATSQIEKRLSKDLFKSDSSIDSTQPTTSKSRIQTTKSNRNLAESVQAINQPPSRASSKNILNKLFESDSEDDQLFFTRPSGQQANQKRSIDEERKSTGEPAIKQKAKLIGAAKPEIEQKTKSIEVTEPIVEQEKPVENSVVKVSEIVQEDKSSKEEKIVSSVESLDKMPIKKELFKNQLEDLFAKKRNPKQGLIKVNRIINDSDDEKNNENESQTKGIETSNDRVLTESSTTNQRKEFDLFDSTPNDLFSNELNLEDTSTLDNHLVKSRVKPMKRSNRRRPTKTNSTISSVQSNKPAEESTEVMKDSTIVAGKKLNEETDKRPTLKPADKKNDLIEDVPRVTSKTLQKMIVDDSSDEYDDFFQKSEDKQILNATLDKKFKTLFDSDDDDLFLPTSSSRTKLDKETREDYQPIETLPAISGRKDLSKEFSKESTERDLKQMKPARKPSIFDDSDDELLFEK